MSRLARRTQCPHCNCKWSLKADWYNVRGEQAQEYGRAMYLTVCEYCTYIPELRRFKDESKNRKVSS